MELSPKFNYLNSQSYQYHVLTKHSLESLYSSPGSLDWKTQPDPFRDYEGALKTLLGRQFQAKDISLFESIRVMHKGQGGVSPHEVLPPPAVPASLDFISNLLFHSMAISAWKQVKGTNSKWALRVNPSSGNLHPTEVHLITSKVDGINDGVYHYLPENHSLEQRAADNILKSLLSVISQTEIEAPPVMLCLTSIFWREAWKYRDRAFRYCQLDLGHASAAICLAAASLGWRSRVIAEFPDYDVASKLGLAGSDEKPMLFILLYPSIYIENVATENLSSSKSDFESRHAASTSFVGKANRLSSSTIEYKSINTVYQATCLSQEVFLARSQPAGVRPARSLELQQGIESIDLRQMYFEPKHNDSVDVVVRRRRSAVDMDGQLRISLARMSRILIDSTRGYDSSFSKTLAWQEDSAREAVYFVHVILYVHRVDGIATGVYYFDRNLLTLTPLSETNVRSHAKYVSCLQDIAADGVFAVSLIADMQSACEIYGERAYRYIHQEAGYIGQLFYLTANALEIDATGIGCFLDDEINRSLPPGMETVYNFTFGRGVIDNRLSNLPAYADSIT